MVKSAELQDSYLFRGLSSAQLDAIAGVALEKQFNGGDTVVRQFEKSSDIHVILEGHVKIKNSAGEDIAELGTGHVVGEVSLIDNSPRSATVIANGLTRTALIPADALNQLMAKDDHMKATVMEILAKVLCSRLRLANIQLVNNSNFRN